ncbi:MAG: radical SAM protein [Vallitaleaceae bacterium]|nr:radical SAM protein [Vallitaleaceae bacterium]
MLNTNEVRIETCTKCNYSCIFCPHSTKFKRKKEIMTLKKFCFIVDKIKKELSNITDLTISGFGEAFLDNTIIDKIRYAKELGFKIHILSNGSYLFYLVVDQLNEIGVEDIRISLHSIYNEAYKKLTKASKQQHKNVLQNIEYIIEKTDINLILTFEIIPGINDDQIEKIKEKYSDCATIEMWKPHNWVDVYKFRKGYATKSTCGRPWNSPYQIQVDGTVNMCCFDYNGELLLGNFLTQSMENIFNSADFLKLRKHHENGILNDSEYICKDCDQRKNQSDIIIYNNKFDVKNRLNRTSTTYAKI